MLSPDTPKDNIHAMVNAAKTFGRYPNKELGVPAAALVEYRDARR